MALVTRKSEANSMGLCGGMIAIPYEQRSIAAVLRQFTFLVAQCLVVDKAALVSRSSTHNKKPHCKNAADLCGDKSSLKQRCKSLLKRCDKDIRTVLS